MKHIFSELWSYGNENINQWQPCGVRDGLYGGIAQQQWNDDCLFLLSLGAT
ncbi:MAG: hypothetical protein ABIU63_08580 [Chitinophagaceae bacterium]